MARHRPGDSSSDDDGRGGNGGPPAKRVKRFRHKSAAQAAKEVKIRIERGKGGMSLACRRRSTLDRRLECDGAAASTRLLG